MRFLNFDLIVSYFKTKRLIFIKTKIKRKTIFKNFNFVNKNKFVRIKNKK